MNNIQGGNMNLDKPVLITEEKGEGIQGMNIYQKMLAIEFEMERVKKNLDVQITQSRSYKAVSEVDVLMAVKPLLVKYGVFGYPIDRDITETQVLTTVKEYKGDRTERNELFMRLKTIYRFVNVDNPSEYIDTISYGDGVDTGDKAPGKAMTYADKYALMKTFKMETGDDPDQEGSGDLKKVTESKITPKQAEILERHYTGENLAKLLQANNITRISDLPMKKASELIGKIMEKAKV